jgi:hypothetical protein
VELLRASHADLASYAIEKEKLERHPVGLHRQREAHPIATRILEGGQTDIPQIPGEWKTIFRLIVASAVKIAALSRECGF